MLKAIKKVLILIPSSRCIENAKAISYSPSMGSKTTGKVRTLVYNPSEAGGPLYTFLA